MLTNDRFNRGWAMAVITLVLTCVLVSVGMLVVMTHDDNRPKHEPPMVVDAAGYCNASGCRVFILHYSGRTYLVNNQGGIVEVPADGR